MTKTKQYTKDARAEATLGNGWVSGYASTWDREPDAYGDVVKHGAFTRSLEKWRTEGGTLPLLYNHDQSLGGFIGKVTTIYEDNVGLFVRATFDGTEEAQRVRQLVTDGRLAKFSFAYTINDQGPVTLPNGKRANELRDVEINEVSIVLTPANDHAVVTDFKSSRRSTSRALDQTVAKAELMLALCEAADLLDELGEPQEAAKARQRLAAL